MAQRLDDGERRGSWNPFVGPLALAELTSGRRFFFRAELGAPLYALRVQRGETSGTVWRPALSIGPGRRSVVLKATGPVARLAALLIGCGSVAAACSRAWSPARRTTSR